MSHPRGAGLVMLIAIACGGRASAPHAVPGPPDPDEPAADLPDGVDPACISTCHASHPTPPDPDAFARYCDELCAPPGGEPSLACIDDCERSRQPGAYYDDNGEYQEHEDLRTEDERTADSEACASECAAIPALSSDALDACVAACVADGGDESRCAIDCDPDPYDECRHVPCD